MPIMLNSFRDGIATLELGEKLVKVKIDYLGGVPYEVTSNSQAKNI
jgi:hypothetical protein